MSPTKIYVLYLLNEGNDEYLVNPPRLPLFDWFCLRNNAIAANVDAMVATETSKETDESFKVMSVIVMKLLLLLQVRVGR